MNMDTLFIFRTFILEIANATEKVAMIYCGKAPTTLDKQSYCGLDLVTIADKEAKKS